MSFGALPPVDAAVLPPDIRDGAPERQDAYTAALGFEQLLVQQLTRQLAESARSAMGGDSPYASMLPTAMADGIMNAGGLGLARQLTDAAAPADTTTETPAATPAEEAIR
jgi:Rod binding domain-containing protein